MEFGGFLKKIRNKTFYFHCRKKNHFILFLLSFGPRVHFRDQKSTFWSNTPEYNFQSKTVKLSYFTLEKSFFFPFLTIFFSFISKLPNVARGHQKNKKTESLIGNMVFGGFPTKKRNKTFYFHCRKKIHLILFLLSFGPRVHFRDQKSTFWSNTPEYNFQSKTVKLSYFTLEKSFFFHF
jgi:hypothetical protein